MPIHLPLSRRRFLGGSLAAAAALSLPRGAWAAEAADPNRWALLADTHVWQFRDGEYRDIKPTQGFIEAVRQITALRPRASGAIFTGDCVFLKGEPDDYGRLAAEAKPLREAGLSVHFALGNHDHREHFWTAFPEAKPSALAVPDKHTGIIETPRANWLLLDSLVKTNVTPGELGNDQLIWLARALDQRPDKPAIVLAHHNPDVANGKLSGLRDTKALFEVLVPRKQVKAYVFGHTHHWDVSQRDGLHAINLPPTAWVFDPAQPRGWVDVQLAADGATFQLLALDGKHPKHGEKAALKWR